MKMNKEKTSIVFLLLGTSFVIVSVVGMLAGIPMFNIVFEGIGVSLMGISFGIDQKKKFIAFLLVLFVIAIFLDPHIFSLLGASMTLGISLIINSFVIGFGLVGYGIGNIVQSHYFHTE